MKRLIEKAKSLIRLVCKVPWHSIAIGLLNVDLVVMPFLRLVGMKGWWLFLACGTAASLEFSYWFWLTGTALEKLSGFHRAVYNLMEVLDQWTKTTIRSTNGYVNGGLTAIAKVTSHVMMALWGAAPFGFWIPGLVFCKAKSWQSGYWAMFTGNLVKVAYFMLGWEFVFSLVQAIWR